MKFLRFGLVAMGCACLIFAVVPWTEKQLLSAVPSSVVVLNPIAKPEYSIELTAHEDLRVTSILPSCGCMTNITLDKWEIKNGEMGLLQFRVKPPEDLSASNSGVIIVMYSEKGENALLKRLEIPIR